MNEQVNLKPALSTAMARIKALIEQQARVNHRYKSRTGNLSRATKADVSNTQVSLYIDEAMAKYGIFVHEGQRSWARDPFLEQAIADNLSLIDNIIAEEIDKYLGVSWNGK